MPWLMNRLEFFSQKKRLPTDHHELILYIHNIPATKRSVDFEWTDDPTSGPGHSLFRYDLRTNSKWNARPRTPFSDRNRVFIHVRWALTVGHSVQIKRREDATVLWRNMSCNSSGHGIVVHSCISSHPGPSFLLSGYKEDACRIWMLLYLAIFHYQSPVNYYSTN